jgi:hypothetical protein
MLQFVRGELSIRHVSCCLAFVEINMNLNFPETATKRNGATPAGGNVGNPRLELSSADPSSEITRALDA